MGLWKKMFGKPAASSGEKDPVRESVNTEPIKRIRNAVVMELQAHIAIGEKILHLPTDYWNCPYGLGWIQGWSYAFGEKLPGDSIDKLAIAAFQLDVLVDVAGSNHEGVIDNLSRLMKSGDTVFEEADYHAYLVAQYGIIALGQHPPPPAVEAYANGVDQFWTDRLKQLFNL